jgi:hypothetical protein
MFVVSPTVAATTLSPEFILRIKNQEVALATTIRLLHTLADKLEAKFGPDFLGDEFRQLAQSGRGAEAQIVRIDQLLKQGDQPTAARELRDAAGITWDEAHLITGNWSSYSRDQKLQWIQVHQWSLQVAKLANSDQP